MRHRYTNCHWDCEFYLSEFGDHHPACPHAYHPTRQPQTVAQWRANVVAVIIIGVVFVIVCIAALL